MTKEELWRKVWENAMRIITCDKCPFYCECSKTAPSNVEELCSDFLRSKYNNEMKGE